MGGRGSGSPIPRPPAFASSEGVLVVGGHDVPRGPPGGGGGGGGGEGFFVGGLILEPMCAFGERVEPVLGVGFAFLHCGPQPVGRGRFGAALCRDVRGVRGGRSVHRSLRGPASSSRPLCWWRGHSVMAGWVGTDEMFPDVHLRCGSVESALRRCLSCGGSEVVGDIVEWREAAFGPAEDDGPFHCCDAGDGELSGDSGWKPPHRLHARR